jgi:hypothetical protein
MSITKNSSLPTLGALRLVSACAVGLVALVMAPAIAQAQISCARTLTANVVAIDQPLSFNRLGASNINGMVFALEQDVINKGSKVPLHLGGAKQPGNVELRPDKRPRPLVLRIAAGDCLDVKLTNLLTNNPNPFNIPHPGQHSAPGSAGNQRLYRPAGPRPPRQFQRARHAAARQYRQRWHQHRH